MGRVSLRCLLVFLLCCCTLVSTAPFQGMRLILSQRTPNVTSTIASTEDTNAPQLVGAGRPVFLAADDFQIAAGVDFCNELWVDIGYLLSYTISDPRIPQSAFFVLWNASVFDGELSQSCNPSMDLAIAKIEIDEPNGGWPVSPPTTFKTLRFVMTTPNLVPGIYWLGFYVDIERVSGTEVRWCVSTDPPFRNPFRYSDCYGTYYPNDNMSFWMAAPTSEAFLLTGGANPSLGLALTIYAQCTAQSKTSANFVSSVLDPYPSTVAYRHPVVDLGTPSPSSTSSTAAPVLSTLIPSPTIQFSPSPSENLTSNVSTPPIPMPSPTYNDDVSSTVIVENQTNVTTTPVTENITVPMSINTTIPNPLPVPSPSPNISNGSVVITGDDDADSGTWFKGYYVIIALILLAVLGVGTVLLILLGLNWRLRRHYDRLGLNEIVNENSTSNRVIERSFDLTSKSRQIGIATTAIPPVDETNDDGGGVYLDDTEESPPRDLTQYTVH